MKYNVAQFTVSISDGGAETLIKDYCLMLDKSKFTPVIIQLRRNPDTANDKILTKHGVKIISLFPSVPKPLKIMQRLNYWWYIPYKLKKILKEENIHVLHIHLALLRYVSRISTSLKNIRLLYTCHNVLCRMFERRDEKKAAEHLIRHNNLQIIALHDDMRQEINTMFSIENTVVIRNGIDFNRFRNVAESKEQIRKTLNIPADAFVIGHVGRFHPQKNHLFLAEIFSALCRKKDNAFLLMIGTGELKQETEEKLNSLGLEGKYLILSNRSDIPQLMKAMDVFVFPSLYEGLGIVLIEAQVSGLRCVVSDKVPKEAFQTELAVPVSLKETPETWCDIILDDTVKGKANGNIDDYDMNQEIKYLENLYLS